MGKRHLKKYYREIAHKEKAFEPKNIRDINHFLKEIEKEIDSIPLQDQIAEWKQIYSNLKNDYKKIYRTPTKNYFILDQLEHIKTVIKLLER